MIHPRLFARLCFYDYDCVYNVHWILCVFVSCSYYFCYGLLLKCRFYRSASRANGSKTLTMMWRRRRQAPKRNKKKCFFKTKNPCAVNERSERWWWWWDDVDMVNANENRVWFSVSAHTLEIIIVIAVCHIRV